MICGDTERSWSDDRFAQSYRGDDLDRRVSKRDFLRLARVVVFMAAHAGLLPLQAMGYD